MNKISLLIITASPMLIFSMNTLYSQCVHHVIDNISVEDSNTLIIEPDYPEVPLVLFPLYNYPEVPLEAEVPLEPRTKFLFDGYTVGLNVSYPLINGWYFRDQIGPSVGIVVSTPYGFDLGSFSVGVGAGVEILNVGAENDDFTYNYTGFYLSLESAVYETPAGPISVSGAGGWYGSLVYSGGIMFDYAVPGQSMVIQPYVREIIFTEVDNGNPSYLISIGATIHYDISTLF